MATNDCEKSLQQMKICAEPRVTCVCERASPDCFVVTVVSRILMVLVWTPMLSHTTSDGSVVRDMGDRIKQWVSNIITAFHTFEIGKWKHVWVNGRHNIEKTRKWFLEHTVQTPLVC